MDPAPALQLGSPAAAYAIAPLTKTKLDGTPYVRQADVEAEVLAVVALAPTAWEVATLKSETLVHLARLLWSRKDHVNIGRVIDGLGRRIARIARDFTSGLIPSVAEEFTYDIAAEVNALIFTTTPTRQSEFLEIAFRQAIKRRAINKAEKEQVRVQTEIIASTMSTEIDGAPEGLMGSFEGSEEPADEAAIAAEALRLRPEQARQTLEAITDQRHRDAIILHVVNGWQIFNKDPKVPTLCSHFDMSSRQIHNWIKRALEQMREALGGEL